MCQSPKFYAGVGSRTAPQSILDLIETIACAMSDEGWTLRSGNATGCDQAFAAGAGDGAEIFLPWPRFEAEAQDDRHVYLSGPEAWTFDVAAEVHPAWRRLTQGQRRLHARNVHQVRGRYPDSPRSTLLICWTERGELRGGTATAIKLAQLIGCPVRNLGDDAVRRSAEAWAERVLGDRFEVAS